MNIRPGLLALTLLLTLSEQAQAYSYAAAGKEPLIDAREALLGAATDGKDASATLSEIADELLYLEQHHKVELQAPLAPPSRGKMLPPPLPCSIAPTRRRSSAASKGPAKTLATTRPPRCWWSRASASSI